MKYTIISNLIDFAVYYNIQTNGANKPEDNADCFSNGIAEWEASNIWKTLMEDLKLDTISIYLLENFSNAIKSEDYRAAIKMKEEIYNQWQCPNNAHFLKNGLEYLFKLRKGLEKSDLLKDNLGSIDYLENLWKSKGLNNLDKILNELAYINYKINSFHSFELTLEAFGFIGEETTHPILEIKRIMEYFWVLNPNAV